MEPFILYDPVQLKCIGHIFYATNEQCTILVKSNHISIRTEPSDEVRGASQPDSSHPKRGELLRVRTCGTHCQAGDILLPEEALMLIKGPHYLRLEKNIL